MESGPRVCVVGSANMDLVFRASRLPRPGETLIARSCSQHFGGKGANQAVAAARLGARVAFVSRLGRDGFGDSIRAHLNAEGIDITGFGSDSERGTSVAVIVVDDEGRNSIIAAAGASQALSPDDVTASLHAIRSAAVVVCQLEAPVEAVLAAFRLAKSAGVRTVFNPAPAREVPEELWSLVDVCVPNEVEVELLCGREVRTEADAATAGWDLLRRGPSAVVVTLGERGAMCVTEDRAVLVPPWPVQAADTTGAGDAFVGSLAVSLAGGRPLLNAIREANAVGALATTRLGAQEGLPTRAELDAFLEREGGR